MGKKQTKNGRRGSAPAPKPCSAAPAGPSRVLLLRHGESEANATGRDVADAPLTDRGRAQAAAWKGAVGRFGADVVLVSPLRRAIETALLAFDGLEVHVELCRHAREMWWDEKANWPSAPEAVWALLHNLPRGGEVCCVEEALAETADTPTSEHASIEALRAALSCREESCVAVVCHWGVINALTGDGADNCTLVECRRNQGGRLVVERHHDAPGGRRGR